ncbi:hypothetical protein [Gottfriedia acidiceleris]|uniref:hypothetical protein n=1 Tax=Gottfriedia acidiceleris TaxID=371036 RepID=UPI002FFF5A65
MNYDLVFKAILIISFCVFVYGIYKSFQNKHYSILAIFILLFIFTVVVAYLFEVKNTHNVVVFLPLLGGFFGLNKYIKNKKEVTS